jgi:flagellar biosynthesis protein FlhG
MTDAYAMIKVLVGNKFAGGISVVVNMADTTAEGKKTYRQIVNVAKRFLNIHVYDAGILLRDERLVSAVRQRKPVVLAYPRAEITLSLGALAAKLHNISTAVPSDIKFFKKVIDWFF